MLNIVRKGHHVKSGKREGREASRDFDTVLEIICTTHVDWGCLLTRWLKVQLVAKRIEIRAADNLHPFTFPGRCMPSQTSDFIVASFRTASRSRVVDCERD